jgi:hypothetical protein
MPEERGALKSLKKTKGNSSRVSERRFIAPKVMPKRCVVLEEN